MKKDANSTIVKQYIEEIDIAKETEEFHEGNFTEINYALPKGLEGFNLCVISGVNFGNQSTTRAEFKKLLSHIKQIESDPLALVIINGEMTNFLPGKPEEKMLAKYNYDSQRNALTTILAPIADKIIAITNGGSEFNIIKKDGRNILKEVSEDLNISDRYAELAYNVNFILNNHFTDNRDMSVSIIGEYGKGVTNTLRTANTKNLSMSNRLRNANIVITSCAKTPMISRELSHRASGKQNTIEKSPIVFISTGNYRKYTEASLRKNLNPYYTDNYYYPCYFAKNLDYVNVRGTGQISEPYYKLYIEQMNFGFYKDYANEYRQALAKFQYEKRMDESIEDIIMGIREASERIKREAKAKFDEAVAQNTQQGAKTQTETKEEKPTESTSEGE